MIFENLSKFTCSAESQDGPMPCASQDGPTTGRAGPAPARVSRFRQLDSDKVMPINDTSGPLFTASSPSAALQWFLESRLRARMDVNGSPLFALTWKQQDMPSGPPICQLAASARRTSGSDCGSWHSPTTENRIGTYETAMAHRRNLERLDGQVQLASWPTPDTGRQETIESFKARVERMKERHPAKGGMGSLGPLHIVAQLTSWPTPTLHDAERGGQAKRAMGETRHGSNLQDFALTAWATPSARDFRSNEATEAFHRTRLLQTRGKPLNEQAYGTISSGSPAPMEKRGQLNPAFSRWLMGYPAAWDDCAPTATRSSHRLQQSS